MERPDLRSRAVLEDQRPNTVATNVLKSMNILQRNATQEKVRKEVRHPMWGLVMKLVEGGRYLLLLVGMALGKD